MDKTTALHVKQISINSQAGHSTFQPHVCGNVAIIKTPTSRQRLEYCSTTHTFIPIYSHVDSHPHLTNGYGFVQRVAAKRIRLYGTNSGLRSAASLAVYTLSEHVHSVRLTDAASFVYLFIR